MDNKLDIDRFFEEFADTRKQASVDGVFGTPIEADGQTVIPIASAIYGYGIGAGVSERDGKPNAGAGGGGGYMARPMAMAVINKDGVRIKPIMNPERIAIAGILMIAWSTFWVARVFLRLASALKRK